MFNKIEDIFEYIKRKVKCNYISDLQYGRNRVIAILILEETPRQLIENKQYTDICRYLGIWQKYLILHKQTINKLST